MIIFCWESCKYLCCQLVITVTLLNLTCQELPRKNVFKELTFPWHLPSEHFRDNILGMVFSFLLLLFHKGICVHLQLLKFRRRYIPHINTKLELSQTFFPSCLCADASVQTSVFSLIHEVYSTSRPTLSLAHIPQGV